MRCSARHRGMLLASRRRAASRSIARKGRAVGTRDAPARRVGAVLCACACVHPYCQSCVWEGEGSGYAMGLEWRKRNRRCSSQKKPKPGSNASPCPCEPTDAKERNDGCSASGRRYVGAWRRRRRRRDAQAALLSRRSWGPERSLIVFVVFAQLPPPRHPACYLYGCCAPSQLLSCPTLYASAVVLADY